MNNDNYINKKLLPPSNILAEEILIGQLLSDNAAKEYIIENTVSYFFTTQRHQVLYNSIRNSQHVDATTIISQLWSQKVLKKIGGVSYIITIINRSQAISTSCNTYNDLEYWIKTLKNHFTKRLFTQYGFSILQLSHLHQIRILQLYKKANKYLSIIDLNNNVTIHSDVHKNISQFLHTINKNSSDHTKILSGFWELDNTTYGFRNGELIIVAGRPSMGKTSFAINIAYYNIFNLQAPVYIFSLEMSKNEILDKFISLISNISIQKIRQRIIKAYDWTKIQQACRLLIVSSLRINDRAHSSINYIKEQCKNNIYKKKLLL